MNFISIKFFIPETTSRNIENPETSFLLLFRSFCVRSPQIINLELTPIRVNTADNSAHERFVASSTIIIELG